MIDPRQIENGVLINYRDENGNNQERAFTDESETWKDDAKAFVTQVKPVVAGRLERQAHDRIDNITLNTEG